MKATCHATRYPFHVCDSEAIYGTEDKSPKVIIKGVAIALSSRKFQGFGEQRVRNHGQRPKHVFVINRTVTGPLSVYCYVCGSVSGLSVLVRRSVCSCTSTTLS